MGEALDRPRLRALEAFPVERDGERLVGIRDPGGFTDQIALLPIPLLDLVSLFDGEHTVAEMCDILARRRGEEAPGPEDIAKVVEVPERTVLTRQGEPGDEFFIIIDGTALVTLSMQKGHRLRPGEFFGEMSLLDGGPRSATVVADTPIRLLVISRRHFSGLLKDVPGLTPTLLVTLSKRVRQAEERAERLASASAGL